jgi:hypothetical protein
MGEGGRAKFNKEPSNRLATNLLRDVKLPEGSFRVVEALTALLRRAIARASTNKGDAEYSELMNYLGAQNGALDDRVRILIDSALADPLAEKNDRTHSNSRLRS